MILHNWIWRNTYHHGHVWIGDAKNWFPFWPPNWPKGAKHRGLNGSQSELAPLNSWATKEAPIECQNWRRAHPDRIRLLPQRIGGSARRPPTQLPLPDRAATASRPRRRRRPLKPLAGVVTPGRRVLSATARQHPSNAGFRTEGSGAEARARRWRGVARRRRGVARRRPSGAELGGRGKRGAETPRQQWTSSLFWGKTAVARCREGVAEVGRGRHGRVGQHRRGVRRGARQRREQHNSSAEEYHESATEEDGG